MSVNPTCLLLLLYGIIRGMVELEVYAKGLRNPDKMMGLALELDAVPALHYKVDTNHDLVYMEFAKEPLSVNDLHSIFRKLGLSAKFVGALPPEISSKKKTQRISI
ncbi:MAG: hypothetical protein ACK5LK_10515 [Chthoniobacterales bacterium]